MRIVELSHSINADTAQEIRNLFSAAFGVDMSPDFVQRVNEKPALLATLAYTGEQLSGFKIGYRRHQETFFSWLGAVLPTFQRQGVARALLQHQHASCKDIRACSH